MAQTHASEVLKTFATAVNLSWNERHLVSCWYYILKMMACSNKSILNSKCIWLIFAMISLFIFVCSLIFVHCIINTCPMKKRPNFIKSVHLLYFPVRAPFLATWFIGYVSIKYTIHISCGASDQALLWHTVYKMAKMSYVVLIQ